MNLLNIILALMKNKTNISNTNLTWRWWWNI